MAATKRKLLIVDDDKMLLKAYQARLSNEGFTVLAESSGTNVVAIAEKEKPDLIILDVIMPGLTGWDVLRDLKANPKTKPIPVFVASNIGAEERSIEATDAGAEEYIVKSSITLQELLDKINATLAKS